MSSVLTTKQNIAKKQNVNLRIEKNHVCIMHTYSIIKYAFYRFCLREGICENWYRAVVRWKSTVSINRDLPNNDGRSLKTCCSSGFETSSLPEKKRKHFSLIFFLFTSRPLVIQDGQCWPKHTLAIYLIRKN